MKATREEILGTIKITQDATKHSVQHNLLEMMKEAAPMFRGQDGEFSLMKFAEDYAKSINSTSEEEGK